jgi:hypothetical protein
MISNVIRTILVHELGAMWWQMNLQGEMGRPRNLLLERELRVQPELLIRRVQINPLADLPDDVAAPLGRAEDEVRRRHRQDGAGCGPVVGINLNRAGRVSLRFRGRPRGSRVRALTSGARRKSKAEEREWERTAGRPSPAGKSSTSTPQ